MYRRRQNRPPMVYVRGKPYMHGITVSYIRVILHRVRCSGCLDLSDSSPLAVALLVLKGIYFIIMRSIARVIHLTNITLILVKVIYRVRDTV